MNSSNETDLSGITRSVLDSNGMNRTTMPTPLKALFESEPVSFSGNLTAGEGSAMETPSKAAFSSYVI